MFTFYESLLSILLKYQITGYRGEKFKYKEPEIYAIIFDYSKVGFIEVPLCCTKLHVVIKSVTVAANFKFLSMTRVLVLFNHCNKTVFCWFQSCRRSFENSIITWFTKNISFQFTMKKILNNMRD